MDSQLTCSGISEPMRQLKIPYMTLSYIHLHEAPPYIHLEAVACKDRDVKPRHVLLRVQARGGHGDCDARLAAGGT